MSHDVHISLTELYIPADGGEAEMSIHIFLDDLELALQDDVQLGLFTDREHIGADSTILLYLQRHILLASPSDTVQWRLLGKEMSEDLQAGYFYLYGQVPHMENLTLTHTVLFDLYGDQQSICQIKVGDIKTHALLDRSHSSVKL